VSEAEVMVEGGIVSVLIANELPLLDKWRRLAALQDRAEVMAAADEPEHVLMAAQAGKEAGVEVPLVIEVDIGMARAGVAPGGPAVALAQRIAATDGVRLAGIMGYEGHTLTEWPMDAKRAAVEASVARLVETARAIEAAGVPVPIVSAGGSGSFMITAAVPGITELPAGGACLMDRFYAEECHLDQLGFEHALTVAASIAARPAPDRAIADAGFKTMSQRNEVKPRPVDLPDVEVLYLSAEHANLRLGPGAPDLRIGDRITFIPEYSDTTTFLHDAFVAHRNGRVEGLIPLVARGRLT
jgi:D-threonine aldolase